MDQAAFSDLLEGCVLATADYLKEAQKTAVMLECCASQPLPFEERFALITQEIQERNAFGVYLDSKRFLHRAALHGYEALSPD